MEIIAVISDRVTCYNLISFLSQLWNCLVLGNPKKTRRSQQIVCLREGRLPFWKAVCTSSRLECFRKMVTWAVARMPLLTPGPAQDAAAVICVTGWELCSDGDTACSLTAFLLLSSLDIAQAISRRKSIRCRTLRFSWLHLFFSDLADTNNCSALTSLHHVSKPQRPTS